MGVPGTRDLNAIDLSVPSARFRVDYQAPWEWLTGPDRGGVPWKPDLRDGYVQAKGKNVAFRMGQFKMPVLAMQMESPWMLPLVRRGRIHDLTVDWLDVAGRLPGAMLTVREKFGDIKPRLFLGAFQARRFTEIDAGRLPRHRPGPGAFALVPEAGGARSDRRRQRGDWRGVRAPDWLYGVQPAPASVDRGCRRDGTDRVFATGGLRIWADAMMGTSWYEYRRTRTTTTRSSRRAPSPPTASAGSRTKRSTWSPTCSADCSSRTPTSTATSPRRPSVSTSACGGAAGSPCRVSSTGETKFPPKGYLFGPAPDRLGVILQVGVAF